MFYINDSPMVTVNKNILESKSKGVINPGAMFELFLKFSLL